MDSRFTVHQGSYALPKFGFKVHVSATLESYEKVCALTSDYLAGQDLYWKVLVSRDEFLVSISSLEPPAESGKLFTIYPEDEQSARRVMTDLAARLTGLDGVYILSDRNFAGSHTVFYRYGFFQPVDNCTIERNGQKWQDYQRPFFDLPPWLTDPFTDSDETAGTESGPLDDYKVTEIIKRSNAGNVYLGSRQSRRGHVVRAVVIKESRPDIIVSESVPVPCRQLRENEWQMCQTLKSPRLFMRPVARFDSWINRYYVYDYLLDQTLTAWYRQFRLFEPLTAAKAQTLLAVFRGILRVVQYAHRKGVVLDDIHPDNFVLIPVLNHVHFIDLANAHLATEEPRLSARTDGFFLPEWAKLSWQAQDLRKVGQTALYLISQLNIHQGQERGIEETITLVGELFSRYGFRTNLGQLLRYLLLEGDSATEALRVLDGVTFEQVTVRQAEEPTRLETAVDAMLSWAAQTEDLFADIVPVSHPATVQPPDWLVAVRRSYLQPVNSQAEIISRLTDDALRGNSLNGLVGYLWELTETEGFSHSLVESYIDRVIGKLDGAYLHVRENFYSPYLVNGSSGLALFLMDYDFDKYAEVIFRIADGMNISLAKAFDFECGLAGIAFFLVKLYERTGIKKYLDWADGQLATCNLSVRDGRLYNFATRRYETGFLKGYAGLAFVQAERSTVTVQHSRQTMMKGR